MTLYGLFNPLFIYFVKLACWLVVEHGHCLFVYFIFAFLTDIDSRTHCKETEGRF